MGGNASTAELGLVKNMSPLLASTWLDVHTVTYSFDGRVFQIFTSSLTIPVCEFHFLSGSLWWSGFEQKVGLQMSADPHQTTLL